MLQKGGAHFVRSKPEPASAKGETLTEGLGSSPRNNIEIRCDLLASGNQDKYTKKHDFSLVKKVRSPDWGSSSQENVEIKHY